MRKTPLVLSGKEPETRSTSVQWSISDARIQSFVFGLGGEKLTDEVLNRQIVFGIPAVKSAVNRISDTISALPLHYYTEDSKGGRQKASADPLYKILHTSVNEAFLTSNRWRKRLVMDLLLDGRHVTLIRRNKAGRVHSLWPLDNNKLTFCALDGVPYYEYRISGQPVVIYQAKDVLDFVAMPTACVPGHVDPISSNHDTFGLCRATERYASRMFLNGGVPAYVITGPVGSPAAADRARENIQSALADSAETGVPPLLPPGFTITTLGFKPSEAQLLEVKKHQIEDVARIFGIPPVYLQDLSHGTYQNTEQSDIFYAKHTIIPLLELIEAELNVKLAPTTPGFAEFAQDGLLRGDQVARANAYRTLINTGVMAVAEARELENLPYKGPATDRLLVQGAMMPIEDAGKLMTGNATPVDDGGEDVAQDESK
jgi:HK97 family phage portal protein